MDIRTKAVSPTGRLHLRDAGGELMFTEDKKPLAVVVYGPGSKEYARAQAAQRARIRDVMSAQSDTPLSADQTRDEGAQFLAEVTVQFENIEYGDLAGAELYKAVYGDISIGFIADQVSAFLSNWKNFKKPSAES